MSPPVRLLPAFLAAALVAATAVVPAAAADIARGGELYVRTGTAPLSCGDNGACHGPDPRQNLLRIRRGADNAALIESAIARNRGGMGFLAAHVDARDVEDIAAWLGAVVNGTVPVASVDAAPVAPPTPGGGTATGPGETAQAAPEPLSIAPPFNAGYGGCSTGTNGQVDTVLLALVAFALAAVMRPRRRGDAGVNERGAGTLAGVAVGLSMSVASMQAQAQGAMPGAAAPRFELPTRDGGRVDLDALRGRVVYLDVWASWCAPCRRSMPWMDAMHRRHAAAGLEVVGVNVDTREAERVRFLASTPVGFTIALDPEARVPKLYGTKAMPTSVLIGRDGRVLYVHEGFRDADRAVLESMIEAALVLPGAGAPGAPRPAGGGAPR
jgi:cytochrome c biogenesis protein CcmG/thiol:disulfide interchange protein DsbE